MKWQNIKSYILPVILLGPSLAFGQSTYFNQGTKENILLERLEIKAQKDTVLNFSFIKPFNRKWWVNRLELIKADSIPVSLTSIDKYALYQLAELNASVKEAYDELAFNRGNKKKSI